MIKKILKYCVPAYILSGLITIITYLVITGSYHNLWGVALITIITTLFITLIITGIGLLFGLVPSILIQRPSLERIFYWVGQILAFLVFFAWFINSIFPDIHIPKKKTTAQENEATILSLTDNGGQYFVCIAFDSLKQKFKTPDDFVLNTYTVFEQDSTIYSQKDSIYTVYFNYTLKDNKEKELMAKYIVIAHQAILAGFDIDKYDNAEYMRVYKKQEVLKAKLDKFDKAIN